MREWDIPWDELRIEEQIGTGRFGKVFRGNWHGDVAIKVLNMNYMDDEKTLEQFKMEVNTKCYLDLRWRKFNFAILNRFSMCLIAKKMIQVSTFRKTRHENLVLFMGACMKPPRLAIVTSLSKGNTLYTHIHLRKDKFNMNKTTIIAQQISQVCINLIP